MSFNIWIVCVEFPEKDGITTCLCETSENVDFPSYSPTSPIILYKKGNPKMANYIYQGFL